MFPNRPTSSRRLSKSTIRIALILGLVAVAAAALSSTSFASSLGQKTVRACCDDRQRYAGRANESHA